VYTDKIMMSEGTNTAKASTKTNGTRSDILILGTRDILDYAVNIWFDQKSPITVIMLQKKFGQPLHKCKKALHKLVKKGLLFTPINTRHRPQWYFPSDFASEVYNALAEEKRRDTQQPIGVTGLQQTGTVTEQLKYERALNILEENFIDLLAGRPLEIHNLHFVIDIPPSYYDELEIQPKSMKNKGKIHREIIGQAIVAYTFYPSGTVYITIENSKSPFLFRTEQDHTRLFAFLGGVRTVLGRIINDRRERAIPQLDLWYWTRADKNIDVPIDHSWQFTSYAFQVKHLDFVLNVYIKEMGKDTVKRFENFHAFKQKQLLQVKDLLNPESRLDRLENKIDRLTLMFIPSNTIPSSQLLNSNHPLSGGIF